MRMLRHCHRLPREVGNASSLGAFEISLDGSLLSNLIWWMMSLLIAEGLDWMTFKGPLQPKLLLDSIINLKCFWKPECFIQINHLNNQWLQDSQPRTFCFGKQTIDCISVSLRWTWLLDSSRSPTKQVPHNSKMVVAFVWSQQHISFMKAIKHHWFSIARDFLFPKMLPFLFAQLTQAAQCEHGLQEAKSISMARICQE